MTATKGNAHNATISHEKTRASVVDSGLRRLGGSDWIAVKGRSDRPMGLYKIAPPLCKFPCHSTNPVRQAKPMVSVTCGGV
ncbi:MAG: hypothetical protein AAFQ50_09430, partial [Pseudomonadota bacterium]